MKVRAELDAALLRPGQRFELCIATLCDVGVLRSAATTSTTELLYVDEDGRAPMFPTTGLSRIVDDVAELNLDVNTAYGGHAGKDTLVLWAIAANGDKVEVVRGTVTFAVTVAGDGQSCQSPAYRGIFKADGES